MSLGEIIANYIAHKRSLGMHYIAEGIILTAFKRSVSDVPLRNIRPEMISRFLDRDGTSDETVRKKHRVLSGLFRFAVTRHLFPARRHRTHELFIALGKISVSNILRDLHEGA